MRLMLTIIGFGVLLIDGADKRTRIERLELQLEDAEKEVAAIKSALDFKVEV